MNILVKKDNETFGPYTRDEILEFIQVDELSQDDLGTWEGEESWLPLVSLLASPQEPEIDSSVYDQFEDDEVDHEKMKEWEDVFQDEEENDSKITDSSADSIEESNVIPPVAPLPEIRLPHEPNTLPVDNPPQVPQPVEDTQTENIIGNTEEYAPPPPPSLPLPPPPNAPHRKVHTSEKPLARGGKNRISSSHKIKGLNKNQTVIVVKGEGIISKIYSTSLLFIILFIVVVILGFIGLIFAPDRVAPILKNIGVPEDMIEKIILPNDNLIEKK